MSVSWKRIEFYKRKSDSKAIVIADCGLGQSPGGASGGQLHQKFGF